MTNDELRQQYLIRDSLFPDRNSSFPFSLFDIRNFRRAETVDHTTPAISFFIFFTSSLSFCIELSSANQLERCGDRLFCIAFAGISFQQWIQLLYGQG